MTFLRRAVWGIGSVLGMYVIGTLCGFLFRVLLTKNLSVAEYGLYYAMLSFFSLAFIIRDIGTTSALIKFIPEWMIKKEYGKIKLTVLVSALYSLVVSLLILLFVMLWSSSIETYFFKQSGLSGIFILFSFVFLVGTLHALLTSVYIGFQKPRQYAVMGVVQPLLLLVYTFGLLQVVPNVRAPALALLLSYASIVVLWAPSFARLTQWGVPIKWNFEFLRRVFSFGAKVFLAGIGPFILQYTDSLMLTRMKSVADVGIYNAAVPISNLLLYLSAAITTITLPLFSELLARKLKDRIKEAFRLLYKYGIVIALPAVAVMVTFPELIIQTIFGADYVSAAMPLRILSIGALMNIIAQVNLSYFNASGKPGLVTRFVGIVAIVNVVLNFLFIPSYGIAGAAAATSLSLLLLLIMSAWHLHRHLAVVSPVWSWMKNVLCCLAMIGSMFWLKKILQLNVFVEAGLVLAIAGIIYIILIFLLRVLDVKELKELARVALKR